MSIYWKIFSDARSNDKAFKIAKSVITSIGVSHTDLIIEPYKGGFTCTFKTKVSTTNWSNVVLQTIELAQNIGRAFTLTGNIQTELDMWSNESSITGVTNIQVLVEKSA